MFVRNKMTANPFTVSPSQTVPEALEIITKHDVKRLPVLKDGKLVGLVSSSDIANHSPSKATSLSVGEINYILAKTKISSIMKRDPITTTSGALLEEAATLMRRYDVGCLPVVDDGKLVGIITESNMLDAFIELLGFTEPGTRLTIEAEDAPGILSDLAGIFGKFGSNITHVAVYRGAGLKSNVVVGTNSLNTLEIEASIREHGYTIVYKLENK